MLEPVDVRMRHNWGVRPSICLVLLLAAAVLASCAAPRGKAYRPPPVGQAEAAKRASPNSAVAARGTNSAVAARGTNSVVVARGDTVYGIARRFELPVRAIIAANGLSPPYRLRVGQRLRVPAPRLHVVRAGETVYRVSRRYGIDMAALVRLNRIPPPYNIVVGERLVLPGAAGVEPARLTARGEIAGATGTPPPSAANPQRRERSRARSVVPKPPPRAGRKFRWPVSGRVISRFGAKRGGQRNDGINIAAKRGSKVRAADNGIVVYAGNELKGFGNLLLVKHAGGWITAYAHNESILVARGDRVSRGQVIARTGSTGSVGRPQLHFEIRRGKRAVDPLKYLTRGSDSARTTGARPSVAGVRG